MSMECPGLEFVFTPILNYCSDNCWRCAIEMVDYYCNEKLGFSLYSKVHCQGHLESISSNLIRPKESSEKKRLSPTNLSLKSKLRRTRHF